MASCQLCVPWNLPLTKQQHLAAGGVMVPMSYQESLWYHFHVVMHQKDNWAGEIEAYTKFLLDNSQESVS